MSSSSTALATATSSLKNSAGAVKNIANQISAAAEGLDSQVPLTLTGRALSNLQDQINTLRRSTYAVAQATGTGGSSSVTITATTQELVLSASTTNVTPSVAASVGSFLIVVLTQDGTGGRQITWSSSFQHVTSNDIDVSPNAVNTYLFCGLADGNWWLVAIPILGP